MSMLPFFSKSPQSVAWRLQLDALRQQAGAWWKERTSRERTLLRSGMAVVIVALVWTQALQPALQTIAQSRELLPQLHAQAAQVNALILEAQNLQRGQSSTIAPAALSEALRASLRRSGLDASATLSEIPGSPAGASRLWELALSDANATRVMEWLAALPLLVQLHVQTIELARTNVDGRDRPGHVSGRIVLSQTARPTP